MNFIFAQIFLAYGLDVATYVAIAGATISAAGTAYGFYQSGQQQKRVRQQGEMNSAALAAEQQRQAAADLENQRRKTIEQQRFRATQNNDLVNSGFDTSTGTPLAIMTDTLAAQQREIGDMGYGSDTKRTQLGWQGTQALYGADQQAKAVGSQGTASLISGIGNTASNAFTISRGAARPAAASTPYGNSPS